MSDGQRLPAEWARQAGVMLAWPHKHTDWISSLNAVEFTYIEIAREIARRERLLIICCDNDHQVRVCDRLRTEAINLAAIAFAIVPFNDTWVRDYGSLTVLCGRAPKLLNFQFNAWGGKYAAALDDAVTRTLHRQGVFGDMALETLPIVLEGGSIDVDGAGSLLTTRNCLLAPTRNPDLSRPALETQLKTLFGIKRILWLKHGGLAGDDTDSHIDMLARFCDANTLAYTTSHDPDDQHFQPLKSMESELKSFRTLEGEPYRLIPLPLPAPVYNPEGQRLPASYSNFLIINDAVLLPTYNDPADALARRRLQSVFARREIVSIDCTALIQQYGSLHCLTMQFPEGATINDASRTRTTFRW